MLQLPLPHEIDHCLPLKVVWRRLKGFAIAGQDASQIFADTHLHNAQSNISSPCCPVLPSDRTRSCLPAARRLQQTGGVAGGIILEDV